MGCKCVWRGEEQETGVGRALATILMLVPYPSGELEEDPYFVDGFSTAAFQASRNPAVPAPKQPVRPEGKMDVKEVVSRYLRRGGVGGKGSLGTLGAQLKCPFVADTSDIEGWCDLAWSFLCRFCRNMGLVAQTKHTSKEVNLYG